MAKKRKDKKEEEFKGKIYGPASEKQKMILESDAAITVIGGAAGCLSKDHEVLTPSGWIKISEWKGQQILQYHKDTGVAEFLKPEEFVKLPCDKLTRIEGSGICQELSDEHTVLYKPDYKLESRTLPFAEVAKRHAKSKTKGWTGKFITTFNYSGHGIDMTEGELRLQVAVMADGRVVKEGKDNYTQMRFGKERKYLRLIELCEKFGLRYDDRGAKPCERYSSGLEYEVIVWPKTDEKHFTERYYQCSKEQLMIILDEVFWWDGSFAKAYGGKSQGSFTGRYFSKCKQDADFIQFAGAALGFNTIISTDERGDHCFTTNVMERGHGLRSLANKDKKAEFKEFVPEDGYKYCFVTQTGFFVTRLRDCVVVTGNSGKSFLLQLMALRYVDDPNTRCVMFRRTTPQLTGQGGLYETAKGIYLDLPKKFRPVFKEKDLKAVFPSGASIKYSHMEYEQDKYNHQGLQYTFIGFDEGCQFLWSQIEYLMSRMRSKSKYSSRMVISCNPDADHELARFIDWWLDEDGYPDPDKCGDVRYFIRLDGDFIWADDPQELIDKYWVGPEQDPKRERVPKPVSVTFIGSTIFDNPVVLKDNPEYLSFLEGLPELEKAQLLYGNWKAKPEGSKSFTRSMIKYVDALPPDVVSVRAWDKAMTERTSGNRFPDFTACIKVSRDSDGRYYLSGDYHPEVFDGGDYSTQTAGRFCKRSGERDILIKKQAEYDGQDVTIVFPVDPGQAGGSEFLTSTRNLVNEGFRVEKDPMPTSRSKLTRFQPFCTLAYQGLVFIVRNSFDPKTLEAILKEMENFTGERSTRTRKDDFVDAISSGVNYLEKEDIVQPCVIPRLTAPTLFSKQRLI